jgi:hypothetical protein
MKKSRMKRKTVLRRTRSQRPLSASPPPIVRSPEWASEMGDYYLRTGLYRAADLNRVLGDPREQIVGEPADDVLRTCGVHKV